MFSTMKHCLKQRVVAVIMKDGKVLSAGENRIYNYVSECPRMGMKSGEGYHLCKEVCNQQNHAEVDAIKNAGDTDLKGSELYLFGHTYACESCANACYDAGIERIVFPIQNTYMELKNRTGNTICKRQD